MLNIILLDILVILQISHVVLQIASVVIANKQIKASVTNKELIKENTKLTRRIANAVDTSGNNHRDELKN